MRILIIEDEVDMATAIARGLTKAGFAVDIANDGAEGHQMAWATRYDLLILDLNLPGMDGLEICRDLTKICPELLILILTARSEIDDRIKGLNLGADDYLTKPFHFGELLARVHALLRRDMGARELILEHADVKFDPISRTAWVDNKKLSLTRKELAALEYFLRNPGKVISQEELLEHIWNDSVNPLTNVVRVHINSLRRKLGDDAKNPRHIETVIGQGYRLVPASENEAR